MRGQLSDAADRAVDPSVRRVQYRVVTGGHPVAEDEVRQLRRGRIARGGERSDATADSAMLFDL
jgi:predicted ABC-type ATPase